VTGEQLLVSVIIPTHNRASLVVRAIQSVLSQTHQHLEVIVVDDRSTDGTGGVLERISDPRVRVIAPERRLGVADARNFGIRVSSGRYIAFLDDDDEWLSDKVERQLAAFSVPEPPALVYTGMWIAEGTSRRYGVLELGDEPFEQLLRFPGPITTSGFMIDRERVNGELWFDPTLATFDDGELLLRIGRRWPVAALPEPLYVWHHHIGPRLSEPRAQVIARRRIIEKYEAELAVRPPAAAHHHFRLAVTEYRAGYTKAAQMSLHAAGRADPSNRKLRVLGSVARLGVTPARVALAIYRLLGRMRRGIQASRRSVGYGEAQ
jgi:glycosyltransferase involved in cell wall biosynthesis